MKAFLFCLEFNHQVLLGMIWKEISCGMQFDCAEPNRGQVVFINMWSKMLSINQITDLRSVLYLKLFH